MGPPLSDTPPAMASASTAQLSAQHERLILELLPFKDASKFHEWLNSNFVRGSWAEFWRDHLSHLQSNGGALPAEPEKAKAAQAAVNAIQSLSQKFMLYHPDKNGWTTEDHHVRFMVTVIKDNILKNLWSQGDFNKKGLDIAKAVYEVLAFLKSTLYGVDQRPPSYTQ